ncbi:hypothetical protein FB45DRAFT_947568 [Roridomyces roridus]|uniref:Uncharacterized protein n=1 Tax=Roridomyces roridus TaxID=1738132 RepID=A0AAD7B299_9AGAR|nr:hypothetical protein FB45DRAFT_947568 [Roridomyces roridus]
MSQANHIFKRLQINSRYEDYGLLDYIWVNIDVYMKKPGVEGSSPGYFFMSPVEHFTRASNALGFPQDPWFWSFDPTGKDRLAAEDAAKQGFPEVKMRMRLRTLFWDASVYDALRKFHTARGFDPDSQEVAIHLGYPLYQLASEREETFAHVDEQLEVPEPPAVDHSRGQQTREIGDIPLIPLNTSSALPEQVLAPATSARMAVPGNESSGLFNFFRNWETPEFGSLC